jgi:hypothetical protein
MRAVAGSLKIRVSYTTQAPAFQFIRPHEVEQTPNGNSSNFEPMGTKSQIHHLL